MIAKGAARNNPRQLAVYLMRVERYSTGEPVVLLEFQSAWAKDLNFEKGPGDVWQISSPLVLQKMAAKLIEAFRDWQVLTEGTKQGRDGLYHAEVSPAPEYADKMTPEQWKRAADILGEELGLGGQPRAIVLHGGTDGRKHMHVVWARTDIDEMKIISDGYNFVAHEKASHRMELEFGHEFVPGKHDKRDRSIQEEFPRQDYDFAEAQMAERAGKTVAERKAEIRALQAAAANGQEFKKALEDAGYMLAQGDRGYIVVDEAGAFSALTRNLQGVMKKAEVEAFMADVPLAQLPTIDEAKTLQKGKGLAAEHAEASHEKAPADALHKTGGEMTEAQRKDQIASIRKSCDNAQTFKNALEAAGYVLAKGDKKGFVLVDVNGEGFSLSEYLAGDIKGKDYKAFMAPIDRHALPGVDEAKAIQERRQQETTVKAEKSLQEASKFLSPEAPSKAEEPTAAPPPSKFVRDLGAPTEAPRQEPQRAPIDLEYYSDENTAKRESKFLPQPTPESQPPVPAPTPQPPPAAEKRPAVDLTLYGPKELPQPQPPQPGKKPDAARPAEWTGRELSEEFKGLQPPPAQPEPPSVDPEIEKLRRQLWQRQAQEMQKRAEANAAEYRQAEAAGKNASVWKLEDFDIRQQQALQAFRRQLTPKQPRKGWRGVLDRVTRDEDAEAKKQAEQQEQLELFRARQAQERREYIKRLDQDRARELETLRSRHLRDQAEREKKYDQELERYLRQRQKALDRARQEAEWAKDFKKEQEYRGEDEPPQKGKE